MRLKSHNVYAIAAVPLIHSFAHSGEAAERALFVRVYLDMLVETLRRGEPAPRDWADDLRACLARSAPAERDIYLAELANAHVTGAATPVGELPLTVNLSRATREEIDALLGEGSLGLWVALAREPAARLRPDHVAALVARARAILTQTGDRRLVEAILSRAPVRLEAAPLFLEATGEQRRAILLAAQRADLGRRTGAAAKLAPEVAAGLEFAAIAGQTHEFAEALSAALGITTELAQRIVEDPAGEPLAVALAALGAPRDLSVRIMTARDLREGEAFARIHTLARLSDQLSPTAARRIVAAIAGTEAVGSAPALSPAAPRQAETPSPLLRRGGVPSTASPGTTARSALNTRRP